ncbi:hypothetical protein ACWG0P_01330 [Amedibacillus sp. YH-ame6]
MKKIALIVFAMVIAFSLAACGSNDNKDKKDSKDTQNNSEISENTSKNEKKEDEYDKFSKLKIGMTEDEVNAILGEPVKVDKAYYYYDLMVNGSNVELQVWIDTGNGLVSYISGDFSRDECRARFADSATDLSTVENLESGQINSYEDCVSAFKTSGYLTNISDSGKKSYLWVDANGGYLRVSFKADGSVRSYSGVC